jgi:hypothetical protein
MQVEVKGPVSADSTALLLGLAIEGAGILRPSEHVVGEAIQKGQLIPLLQDVRDPEKYPLWALLPPGRNQAPKVRVFLDFLLERLGSAPWRARPRLVTAANPTTGQFRIENGKLPAQVTRAYRGRSPSSATELFAMARGSFWAHCDLAATSNSSAQRGKADAWNC